MFTAEYSPIPRTLGLTLNGERWDQSLDAFEEGQRIAHYGKSRTLSALSSAKPDEYVGVDWTQAARINWTRVAKDYAAGRGKEIAAYLPATRLGTQRP